MATLAESFLADLDDLSDESEQEEPAPQQGEDVEVRNVIHSTFPALACCLAGRFCRYHTCREHICRGF